MVFPQLDVGALISICGFIFTKDGKLHANIKFKTDSTLL